jgi:Amt family ammonium transporter
MAAEPLSPSRRLKHTFYFDDPMDIFSCHAVSGAVGLLLTGLFAQSSVAFNDAYTVIPGGWLDRNFIQLAKQLAWICVTAGWTFVVTIAIMAVIERIPGCHFRCSEDAEVLGTDDDQLGEFGECFL